MKNIKHLSIAQSIVMAGLVTAILAGCGSDNDKAPTIPVPPVPNTAPEANPDKARLTAGRSILIDVLANDIDADGDPLVIDSASVTAGKGAVSVVNDKLLFESASVGDSTVKYLVSDTMGGKSSSEVSIEVLEEGDASAYVGTEVCLACHTDKRTFLETGHNRMLQKVVDDQMPEFAFTSIAGALEMVDGVINEGGNPSGYEDVSYTLGGHSKVVMWLDKKGYVYTGTADTGIIIDGIVPFAVGSLMPGMTEPVPYPFCGQCHTTGWKDYTSEEGDSRNLNKQLEGIGGTFEKGGVQCEACHGAGMAHATNPTPYNIKKVATSRTIASLTSETMAYGEPKACVECHTSIEDGVRMYPTQTTGFEAKFGGGQRLGSLMIVDTDPTQSGSGGSLAADALLSYDPDTGVSMNKKANFHCTTCHNPHMSTIYRDKPGHTSAVKECDECHTDMEFNNAPGSGMASAAHKSIAKCQDCHMANNKQHLFKINISVPSDDASHFSKDGVYRQPWLRSEESCGGCHEDDFEARAKRIMTIHQ